MSLHKDGKDICMLVSSGVKKIIKWTQIPLNDIFLFGKFHKYKSKYVFLWQIMRVD